MVWWAKKHRRRKAKEKGTKYEGRRGEEKNDEEEGAERKRKAGREEEVERRTTRGVWEATKPNAASQCVSETDCKNRNCKMCNCRALLGWTNAGIAGDVSGRSIPEPAKASTLFSSVDLVQLKLERELRSDQSSSSPAERSFESGNPGERHRRQDVPELWRRLDSEIFVPIVWTVLELRRDFREPIIQENWTAWPRVQESV